MDNQKNRFGYVIGDTLYLLKLLDSPKVDKSMRGGSIDFTSQTK